MAPPRTALLLSFALLPALACGKSEPTSDRGSTPPASAPPAQASARSPAPTATATATQPAATAASAAPGGSAAPGAAAGGTGNKGGVFSGVPTTASKVPTVAEWGAAPEIKDIPGSSDEATFEIKSVREWVKVTAKSHKVNGAGDSTFLFAPEPVVVRKGKDGNVFEFTAKDESLTSVVFALIEGKEREFFFKYTVSGASTLVSASWPKGAPQARVSFKKQR